MTYSDLRTNTATIKTMLVDLMPLLHENLTIPAKALMFRTIEEQMRREQNQFIMTEELRQAIKKVATDELGWEYRELSDPFARGPALVKVLEPDLDAVRCEMIKMTLRDVTSLRYLKLAGLQAAFRQYTIAHDPEGIISESQWEGIFDELGYIYKAENETLIPKPLNLPLNAKQLIIDVLTELPTVTYKGGRAINYQKVKAVIEEELKSRLSEKLKMNINLRQWRTLLETTLAEALINTGFSSKRKWVYKEELIPTYHKGTKGTNIFLPALIISPPKDIPSQFAKGFPIYIPAYVCDGETLVYLELLGPRQAVKANWAALRQKGRENYIGSGNSVIVKKEDGITTLKTTLRECGWDHWCLIHQQASCDKMVPEDHFYLIDEARAPIPANFYAQLAKAAPFPILPHWAEYLWVEGVMNDLITPLLGTGLGGWKVFFVREKWQRIVSNGLEAPCGKILLNKS